MYAKRTKKYLAPLFETISKMLGHTKLTTTQIYPKVIKRKVSDDMEMLCEKLGVSSAMNTMQLLEDSNKP